MMWWEREGEKRGCSVNEFGAIRRQQILWWQLLSRIKARSSWPAYFFCKSKCIQDKCCHPQADKGLLEAVGKNAFWPAFLVFHHKSKLAAKLGGLASFKKDGDSNLDSFRCSLLRAFLSAFWSLTFMRRRPSGGIEPGHPSTSSRRSTWLERWHNSWFGRLSMNRIAQPIRPIKVKSEIKVL